MHADSWDSPQSVLPSSAVLFGWWGTGCEIYTSRDKREQVETQRWTWRLTPWSCHKRREINRAKKTSEGKPTIFPEAARKFLIISSWRPATSAETLSHPLTHVHQRVHTHAHSHGTTSPLLPSQQPLEKRQIKEREILSSFFAAVKGQ